jgi:hypothetical protein
MLGRHDIQHIHNPLVPAPLLRCGRLLFANGHPDAEVAVRNSAAPGFQPAGAEIMQDSSSRLLQCMLAAFPREYHLLAMHQHADEHQRGRLAVLDPGLHIYTISPDVLHLQVI